MARPAGLAAFLELAHLKEKLREATEFCIDSGAIEVGKA